MAIKRLVVGNWKMNPATLDEAKNIMKVARKAASGLKQTEVVACPPFVYTAEFAGNSESSVHLGAQSVSAEESGSFTGQIPAVMLRNLGVEYVIVGHSEERKVGITDADVSRKARAVLAQDMKAVVCVGEMVRDEGGAYLEELTQQIKNSLADVPKSHVKNLIIAYEPVWAIGATEAMHPAQIYETSLFVRKTFSDMFGHDPAMRVRVLYGGAANARNAAEIIAVGQVDGLLVGRESINTIGLPDMLAAVDEVKL
jgi:triosephosphate isomerase